MRDSATGARGSPGHPCAVGFDIGGTKIACGVIDGRGGIVESLPPFPTPGDQASMIDTLTSVVTELRGRHPLTNAVGVGAAGLINWPEGFVRWAPNNSYRAMPLRGLLEEATGLAAVVDNDANVAAWAEARLGRSADYMMFVTVGTGIGGGILLGQRLFRGSTGIGAEIGHMIVDPYGGHTCGCGNVGCLEAVASGNALGRYGQAAAAVDPFGTLVSLAGAAANVTGETVFQAALAGDPTSRSLYARLGNWLGIGLASLTTLFDLQLIVVGGGVARAGDLLLEPARASLSRYLFADSHRSLPAVVPATLGVEAGWVGAALLALDSPVDRSGLRQPGASVGPPRIV